MKIVHEIKRLFRKLTPLEMASYELAEAELSKLEAQSAKEYAKSVEDYNESRIKRLRAFVNAQSEG